MKIKVAPSLLSADFSCLSQEIKQVSRAGADMLHIDVMDGHFVPNITIGPVVLKDISRVSKLDLDVHLMIEDPMKFVEAFVDAGSTMITVHIEAMRLVDIKALGRKLRSRRVRFGISLNPATALAKITPLFSWLDFVLVMSVNPGFSGQSFRKEVLPKIKALRAIWSKDIAVDGGINDQTAALVVNAGANVLVAGSYIFGAQDKRQAIERIRNAK